MAALGALGAAGLFLAAVGLFGVTAFVAVALPVLRAASLEPMSVLREE